MAYALSRATVFIRFTTVPNEQHLCCELSSLNKKASVLMDCRKAISLLVREDIYDSAFEMGITHIMECQQCWDTHDWLLDRTFLSTDPVIQDLSYAKLGIRLIRVGLYHLQSKPHLHQHAEECAQEALLGIWERLSKGQGPNNPRIYLSWCNSIMTHKTLDLLRKEGELRRSDARTTISRRPPPGMRVDMETIENLPGPLSLLPTQLALKSTDLEEIAKLVLNCQALRENERQVLYLGYLCELTDIELSEELNMKNGTIRSHRSRAIKRLREQPALMELLYKWFRT